MLVERVKGRDYHQSLVIPFTLLAIAPVFCISKSICIYITTLPVPLPHALHQLVHQYKSKTNRKRNNSRYTTFDNLSRMGLFQSILTLCPCSTPRKTVISPEVISHPYPLAPKYPGSHGPESRFRPNPLAHTNNNNPSGPYRQLESPTHSHAHSKTVSESTTSTAPQSPLSLGGTAMDGLGLGMRYGLGELRAPDRAYVLAERNSTVRSMGGDGE
jgi:hypothetical protein